MRRCAQLLAIVLMVGVFGGLAAAPAHAAGFGIFEHGSRAMGMAGAFTAQADDPSAMFHNVAGLAFQRERRFMVGTTLIALGDSTFEGAAPFPGPGVTGEQEDQIVFPSHLYYVQPLGEEWTFGLGVNNPFGLVTEWRDPDEWAGRFLSTRADLATYDLNPSLGWQVTPRVAVGFGAVVRFAEVELDRRVARVNPFTLRQAEVARIALGSDLDTGLGWNVGFLHKYNNSFSWGFSYRSKVEVDFGGDARFTQVSTGFPQFDAAVAAAVPFGRDLPIQASIEFPDMASLGVALALSPASVLEVDVNWTGWSSFDTLVIEFTENPEFTSTLVEAWDDVYNYRLGLRWAASSRSEWRLGYVYDETPQPEASVSPLLPDADRNGYTLGYGYTSGGGNTFDVAFMYLPFDDRTTTEQRDDFNGAYQTTAYLLGLTLGF